MKKITILISILLLFTGCNKNEYQVMFNSNGGTIIETQVVEKNKTAVKPVDPIKEGYDFQGWKLNNKDYTFKEKVKKDIILDAEWKISSSVKTYKVTYKIDDNKTEEEVVHGQCANEPKKPTKNGYIFLGWYLGDEEEPYTFEKIVTEDLLLVAKFKKDDTYSSIDTSNQIIFITELEVSATTTILEKNETVKIEVITLPENATNQTVDFKTSNRRIATVSDDGVVKGLRPGEVTITISTTDTSGIEKTIKFTVVNKKD